LDEINREVENRCEIYNGIEKLVMKKLLLFDLDWTLIYTGGAGVRAFNHAFEKLFSQPQALTGLTLDGKTDRAIARELIKVRLERDPSEGDIEKLCAGYLARLREEVPQGPGYKILPGIAELLKALSVRCDVLMGLGTGNLKAGAEIKLTRADFWRYFAFGGFADDSEVRSELLAAGVRRGEALSGKKFAPRDVIVIGDNFRDVEAGQAIGATVLAVATGTMKAEALAAYHPDYLVNDLSDTEKIIHVLTV
jgi:phosphoglycolate phosphatase-like HAD superfamily hydrolase